MDSTQINKSITDMHSKSPTELWTRFKNELAKSEQDIDEYTKTEVIKMMDEFLGSNAIILSDPEKAQLALLEYFVQKGIDFRTMIYTFMTFQKVYEVVYNIRFEDIEKGNKMLCEDQEALNYLKNGGYNNLSKRIGEIIGIDWNKINLDEFSAGVAIEFLEHGIRPTQENNKINVIGSDIVGAGKIAFSHLKEKEDYYSALIKMEKGK